MKTFFHNKNKIPVLITFVSFFTFSFSLSSCKKENGSEPQSTAVASALSVIHASPDSPTLQFVLDDKPVKQFSYPDGIINYFAAFSGSRSARIYEADKLDNPLYEFELRFVQGDYYSLFIGGKKNDLKSFLLQDNLSTPARGKAKIRFIHLGLDAPALDFLLSPDSVIASNKKFGEYTSFQEVKPGNYMAVIKSFEEKIVNIPMSLKIDEGKIYSIWIRGLNESTGEHDELGYSIFQHKVN